MEGNLTLNDLMKNLEKPNEWLGMYTVKDRIGESYSPPFYSPTHKTAQREYITFLHSSLKNQARPFNPTDFNLCCVGAYNKDTAEILAYPKGMAVDITPSLPSSLLPQND